MSAPSFLGALFDTLSGHAPNAPTKKRGTHDACPVWVPPMPLKRFLFQKNPLRALMNRWHWALNNPRILRSADH